MSTRAAPSAGKPQRAEDHNVEQGERTYENQGVGSGEGNFRPRPGRRRRRRDGRRQPDQQLSLPSGLHPGQGPVHRHQPGPLPRPRPCCPRPPGRPLDQHPAAVPPPERQADLLPLARVPHRPGDGQQRHLPRAGRDLPRGDDAARPGLGRAPRRRGRCRSRQRRPRPARRLLPRFDGDPEASGHRLRHPLRLRRLQAVHRQRQPGGRAGQLAALRQPLGGRPPGALVRRQLRGPVRAAAGERRHPLGVGQHPAHHRHGLRHADRRLRHLQRQQPAGCGRPEPPTTSTSRISAAAPTSRRWKTRSWPRT